MRSFADLWPVVLGMALVTYATRVGGLWIVSLASTTPRLSRILHHLATGVLTALVVSGLRTGEAAVYLSALAAILVMHRTGNMLAAIAGSASVAALVRAMSG